MSDGKTPWLLFGARSIGLSPAAFSTQKGSRLHLSSTGRMPGCVSWTSSRSSRCPFLRLSRNMAPIFSKFMEKAELPRVSNADLEGLQRHTLPAAMSSCGRVRRCLGGSRLAFVLGRHANGLRFCTWNPRGLLGSAASSHRTGENLKYLQTIAEKSDFLCVQETHGRIEHHANIDIVLDRAIWIKIWLPSPLVTRMLVALLSWLVLISSVQKLPSSTNLFSLDVMNRFPDTFQTVTDRSLYGLNVPHCMNALTRWLTNSGCVAQALSSLNHSSTLRQTIMSAMSQQLQSDLGVAGTSDPLQHRPPLPKRDILAVDEEPPEEWEAEDDVKG